MSMPGLPEMIVLFCVITLLFGGKKLPELGGALGESIRNFRKGIKDAEGATPQAPSIAQAESKATTTLDDHKPA